MQNECLLAYCRTRSIGCYSIIAAHEAINSRICLSCSQKAAKHLVIAMKIMELSHRFREINAVGTLISEAVCSMGKSRIASERSTLLAQHQLRQLTQTARSHRFREINAVGTGTRTPSPSRGTPVASLPRDQRCWHIAPNVPSWASLGRIASERSTLWAHDAVIEVWHPRLVASLPRNQRCWHL